MTADKEKRRATSREAARRRRRVESDIFGELSGLLPLQPSVRAHVDKPSIIRLTLSYIRLHALLKGTETDGSHTVKHGQAVKEGRNMLDLKKSEWDEGQEEQEKEKQEAVAAEEANMLLRILQGFLMVVSTEGHLMFLSDNVSQYLGLTQSELMGHNIFQYTHPYDHEEIRQNLHVTEGEVWCGAKREFSMRIKSALTHRGRSTNLKSATWKVLHCRGRAKVCAASSSVPFLLFTCQPLPLLHAPISTHTFTSQHSMDLRFIHCDERVTALLGYSPEELLGCSIYNFCHMLDRHCLANNHMQLLCKNHSVSGRYRMLVRGGGYVWVESHSSVVPSVRPSRARPGAHRLPCILSVTYVLSGVVEPLLQLSLDQVLHRCLS